MIRKTVLMLVGPSGCGKSTLERQITGWGSARKVISVTTRDSREGEVDGVDYHFISDEEFSRMEMENELLQMTGFGGYKYGSTRSEYTTWHPYVTLCVIPMSAVLLKHRLAHEYPDYDVKVIYFDITKDRLVQNMKKRGDTELMVTERLLADDIVEQMEVSGLEPDFVVTDELLTTNLCTEVMQYLNTRNPNGS